MKYVILRGSPRKNGNTNALTDVMTDELVKDGSSLISFDLYDMNISGCTACRNCQKDWEHPGCTKDDDMQKILDAVMDADVIVVSTPVYSWYSTPPVKAVLDRLVYSMNKYYGERKGPSLWKGKHLCLIATCGYPVEKGADLLEEGIRRYCRHSQLVYDGALTERHEGYDIPFMTQQKTENVKAFVEKIKMKGKTNG